MCVHRGQNWVQRQQDHSQVRGHLVSHRLTSQEIRHYETHGLIILTRAVHPNRVAMSLDLNQRKPEESFRPGFELRKRCGEEENRRGVGGILPQRQRCESTWSTCDSLNRYRRAIGLHEPPSAWYDNSTEMRKCANFREKEDGREQWVIQHGDERRAR